MWKALPETLKNPFSIRERNFGNQNKKSHLPIANTNLFKLDIVYQRSKFWNFIPSDTRRKKNALFKAT